MKKNALRGLAASGLLVMGLTACGGGAATTDASSAPASEASSPAPAQAKQYTTQQLTDLVKQIKAADGTELMVSSIDNLAGQQDPLKQLLGSMNIEPAECKNLAMAGASQPIEGATGASGAKIDTASGVITSVTLASGVSKDVLEKNVKSNEDQITTCSTMTMSMSGTTMTMKTEKFDGIGSVPGTLGIKTTMTLPDGQTQSTLMAAAIKDGVLISATASGKSADNSGAAAAGALMDQAAALIK